MPEESYRKYRLYVQVKHQYPLPPDIKKGDLYWTPIGCEEGTVERAKSYLKSDINLWKEYPNPRYKIVETIHWRNSNSDVEEGSRERGLSEI